MPTAARFVAALCLAVLAWVVSEQIKPLFDEDKAFGNFNLINFVIAVAVGWQVIGSRAGRGLSAAINNGLTGGTFWSFGDYLHIPRSVCSKYRCVAVMVVRVKPFPRSLK